MTFPFDIAVVFLPLVGAVVAGLFGRAIGNRASQIVTCACVLVAAGISIYLFNTVALHGHDSTRTLLDWIQSGTFSASWGIRIDTLTAVMLVVVNGVSSMVHVYSIGYMSHDKSIPRFMSYLSLFTFFMLMLVTSDNLLQLFFGWEGVGLASYLLINFWYEKDSANNASIKAFLVNRVGDFGFALGIFGCYMLFGSVNYADIFAKAPQLADAQWIFLGHTLPALTTVCLLLFVGAMGKSAQLGLHTWLPDAMEGPTPVSALIHAATMVTAGVFMTARLSPVFEYAPDALKVVTIVGAVTCIVAASIGMTQFDIKRVIAYSTMSQLGYMFFAAGVSAYSAAIFHLMTHACFKALLFLGAGSVIHAMSGEQDMRKMGGIWRKIPITYALMWAGSLAIAGIGLENMFGFAGFYSKDLILEAAVASKTEFGMFAYILGTAAAFMTAFYSWRLLFLTFHGAPRASHHTMEHVHESPWIMLGPLVPLALGAVFAGWYADGWFAGPHRAEFWNGAILVLKGHHSIAAAENIPEYEKWLPLGVALPGIIVAYVFYMLKPEWPGKVAHALGAVYRLVYHKYYFDEIYDFLFVRTARRIGKFLWQTGDEAVIDGYGPDGFASLSMQIAKRVGALETGYLYHYAFAMVIGVAGFITWFWFKG
ncbi:MAG: NADH-quinone oxidoreductase subunit L [Alphaproteobacteria bacterium]|nr:NADH-quinone oxidoreductase subunit L [Alphaproteobacteria bacterium]